MNCFKKKEAASKLMEEIKKLPLGTRTTTAILYKTVFGSLPDDEVILFDINNMLLKMSEKEGYFLDGSEHEGKEEGLPFNLDFIIKRKI